MTGLALSGGGGKGAFEVGVILHLAERTDAPRLRQYAGFLHDCWTQRLVRTRQVWRPRFPTSWLVKPSIGDNSPLRRLLTDLLEGRPVPDVEMPAVNLLTGRTVWLKAQQAKGLSDLVSMALASSAFPGVFPPESRPEGLLTDGGAREIQPALRLVDTCDRILAISCRGPNVMPKAASEFRNPLDVASRVLDIMESELLAGDLPTSSTGVDHIVPEEDLGDPLDFSEAATSGRIKLGVRAARAYFDRHRGVDRAYAGGFDRGVGCSVGAVSILGLPVKSGDAA